MFSGFPASAIPAKALGMFRSLLLLIVFARAAFALEDYKLGPDSQPQDVPHGEVKKAVFDAQQNFPRDHAGILGVCAETV